MAQTNENLKLSGRLQITRTNADGEVVEVRDVKNLIVNAGLSFITARMAAAAAAVMSHMAVGSGVTAAAPGDTNVETIIGARRTLDSTVDNGGNIVYVATFGAGVSTGSLTEAGLFNALTSGTMLCRTVFATVTKGASDTVVLTWTITITAS